MLGCALFSGVLAHGDAMQDEWFEDPVVVDLDYSIWGTWQGDLSVTSPGGGGGGNHPSCSYGFLHSMGFSDLVPYTKFSTTISGANVSSVHISLKPQFAGLLASRGPGANAPAFRVLVDGEEKYEWDETNPAGCTTPFSKTYEIEVRPHDGLRPVPATQDAPWSRTERNLSSQAAVGDATWPSLGPGRKNNASYASAKWNVSMGRISHSSEAGQIRIRKYQANSTALNAQPSILLFSTTKATQNEVTVLTSGGSLRQVKAPQALADVVTISGSSFEIRFYIPSFIGAFTNGVYTLVAGATPFVTYKFESGTSVLKITEQRNGTSYVGDIQYNSGTKVWSLQTGANPDTATLTRAIVLGTSTNRTETLEVKNASGVLAYKAVEEYQVEADVFPYLLKSTTVNPGASQLVTTYDYYTNYLATPAEWGWLRSITRPDGSWEKREYGDDPIASFTVPLARVLRPWKDAPTSPSSANEFNSHITEYEYQELANGTPYVNQITSSYEATYYDSRSWTRAESFPEADSGTDLRQEKHLVGLSDVGDMVTSKSYTDANTSKAGLPYSERYANGTRKSLYYQKGTYNPSTYAFTVDETNGTDWRMTSITGGAPGAWGSHSTFEGKTIEPLYIIPKQSIKQTKVIRNGNVLLRENHVISDSLFNSELLDRFIYTTDTLGHTTKIERKDPGTQAIRTIYASDWRSPSNNQDGDLKMSETDEFGVQTTYTYDGLKRVKTVTKKGAAAGGFPAQSDIVTTFTYDAMDRVLTRVVSGGGLSLTSSYTYDLAGRLLTETSPEQLTTTYTYANGGRTTTITYPGGATQVIDKYLDGRIKSITGTAVVNRFYDYGQTFNSGADTFLAKNTTIENISSSTSTRQKTYLTDLREVLTEQRIPGQSGATLVHDLAFNSFGQLTTVERPTPNNTGIIRTLNEYDPSGNLMGNIARTGLDVNPVTPAQFTLASLDRIYESSVVFEKIGSSWYLTSTDQKYLTDNNNTPTVAAIRRERVTGLAASLRSETTLIDADNNSTLVTVTLDVANKKATTVINTAQSTLDATSITVNGLVQSASTPTVSTPTLYFYDGLARQTRVQNPIGFSATTTFHATTGQITATTDLTGQATSYEYYPGTHLNAGRLKTQTAADGKKSYFEYSARGELIHRWGGVPYPEERVYDSFGQLTEVHTYRGGTAADWSNSTWPGASFTHDDTKFFFQEATGLLTSQQDALGRSVTYEYYPNNLFKKRTWARGSSVTFNISDLGDVTGLNYSDTTPDVAYTTFDRTGRPRSITDATGGHTLTYDYAQRLIQDTATSAPFSGITLKNRFDAVYGRDQLKLEITGQSTIQHDFSYDTYGRLSTAAYGVYSASYGYLTSSDLLQLTTSKNNGVTKLSAQRAWEFGTRLLAIANTAGNTPISWDTYTFDPVSRRARTSALDGSAWQYDYDERGELKWARRFWADFTPVAGQQFEFSYDSIGNRISQKDGGDETGGNLRTTAYTANAANQYTSLSVPNAVDIQGVAFATATVTVNGNPAYRKGEYYCYALPVSNSSAPVTQSITVVASQGGNNTTTTGTVLVPKSATTLAYDLDGNLTSDGLWSYSYDAENRLIQIESDASIGNSAKRKLVFTYDHAGRRATKKVYLWSGSAWSSTPSLDLRMVYDARRLLAELDATANAPQRSNLWVQDLSGTLEGAGGIGGLVVERDHVTASYHFPAFDGRGNLLALVNAANQSISACYEYAPFGKPLRATGDLAKSNPLRFSTKPHDEETGLVLFGGRYYHPDLGRWANRDPIGISGGINLYAYGRNRPTGVIDPWGTETEEGDGETWRDKAARWVRGMYPHLFPEDPAAALDRHVDNLENLRDGHIVSALDTYIPSEFNDALREAAQPLEHLILGHQELEAFAPIPVFGAVFNAANAGLYAAEGNWGSATWNFGMAILAGLPVGGGARQAVRAPALSLADDTVRFLGRVGDAKFGTAAAKVITEPGAAASFGAADLGNAIVRDRLASRAYATLQQRGVDLVLYSKLDNIAGSAGNGSVRINLANNASVQHAASTLIHEAKHIALQGNTGNLYGLRGVRSGEYSARALEFFYQTGRRPNAIERARIQQEIVNLGY